MPRVVQFPAFTAQEKQAIDLAAEKSAQTHRQYAIRLNSDGKTWTVIPREDVR